MTNIATTEHERQRFEHLALGRPRPRAEAPKKKKGRKIAVREPVLLAAGVEQWVALREDWSHKAQGTPETHEAARRAQARPGAIARLFTSGAIDCEQIAAADAIREAHRAIAADVPCRTASWEPRAGGGGGTGSPDLPHLETVEASWRYDWWCRSIDAPIGAMTAIIIDDVGLTIVAARYGMSTRRLRGLLTAALDLWWKNWGITKRADR